MPNGKWLKLISTTTAEVFLYCYAIKITIKSFKEKEARMSEYEFISLISLLRQEAAGFQWQFFSIWSAYMLVVYFIGRNFPDLYVYILTLLYTVFVIVPTIRKSMNQPGVAVIRENNRLVLCE